MKKNKKFAYYIKSDAWFAGVRVWNNQIENMIKINYWLLAKHTRLT